MIIGRGNELGLPPQKGIRCITCWEYFKTGISLNKHIAMHPNASCHFIEGIDRALRVCDEERAEKLRQAYLAARRNS